MRILRVELNNIKSYRKATIHLEAGTTAIRGQNGAGKSTLVEAIGFALFGYSPYKPITQFVREGERAGQITIAFKSAFDDREYEVVRRIGAVSDWFVYDPEISERVVEQHADVETFLRRHLRIEGEVGLAALFSDALGVPQGTFTADFLMTPEPRKKKFNALLQVEEYAKAFEKLNATRAHLKEQLVAQDHRIELLERETGQLGNWREHLASHRARERALIDEISAIQRETAIIEARRETLRKLQAHVTQLSADAQLALAAYQAADERRREAQTRHEAAQAAVATLAATRAEYIGYQEAETHLADARTRAHERDELRTRRQACAQRHALAEQNASHASKTLEEARQAAERIADLQPRRDQQEKLEKTLTLAHEQAQQLNNTRAALARTQKEIAALQEQIASAEQAISQLERLRPLASQLDERRAQLEVAQSAAGARAQRMRRLQALTQEYKTATQTCERAAASLARANENVNKILKYARLAAQVPALEQEHDAIEQQARTLEATRAQHALAREQSGGGNCPFLREPCLNIQRRGANSLVGYFDTLIATCDAQLAPMREQLAGVAKRLDGARKAREAYGRLESYQDGLRMAQEAQADQQALLARLDAERSTLEHDLEASPDAQSLEEIRRRFAQSLDADKRLSALDAQRDHLTHDTERLAALTNDATAARENIAALEQAPQQERMAAQALKDLGDPRAEIHALTRVANQRADAQAALTRA
ncbi:MAG TPA: SMC family ATPase, partial [Ktedonobacterales bacterium]|nr:SMC family ATPase [Ktedonobacterales bacterium]